jgi:dihydropteroate synthase
MTAPFEVMGVLNVTPDSFSDGDAFLAADAAVAHARGLVADGAGVVDVGGESTRPGAAPVPADEELRRVVPVLERLAGLPARVSIDTSKAAVARAALERGAEIVNDVTALRGDAEMAGLVASTGATCCLVHMRGTPQTMQDAPSYRDVVSDVKEFLERRLAFATAEGVAEERVWLDPGIGFGKTIEHNLELLARLGEICAIGRPVVLGTSRKGFLGRITGRAQRDLGAATVATAVMGFERGARVFRVHDVREHVDALKVAAATVGATGATVGRRPARASEDT